VLPAPVFTSAPQLIVIADGKKAKLSGSVASTYVYIRSTIGSDCGWKKAKISGSVASTYAYISSTIGSDCG
jgi:hypothetical protein